MARLVVFLHNFPRIAVLGKKHESVCDFSTKLTMHLKLAPGLSHDLARTILSTELWLAAVCKSLSMIH